MFMVVSSVFEAILLLIIETRSFFLTLGFFMFVLLTNQVKKLSSWEKCNACLIRGSVENDALLKGKKNLFTF